MLNGFSCFYWIFCEMLELLRFSYICFTSPEPAKLGMQSPQREHEAQLTRI